MRPPIHRRWIALLPLIALLVACASAPGPAPSGATGPAAGPLTSASRATPAAQAGSAAPAAPSLAPAAGSADNGPAPAQRAAATTIITSPAMAYAPLIVGRDQGIFAAEGLDFRYQHIAGASTALAALIAGEAQFFVSGTEAGIVARAQGADVRLVSEFANNFVQSLYVQPSIQGIADLKGKRAGVSRRGSTLHFVLRAMLTKWGLDPEADVVTLQVGNPPETLAALQSGAIDMAIFSPETYGEADRAGFRRLASAPDVVDPTSFNTVWTASRLIAEQPDVVRRFVRAVTRAQEHAVSPANRDQTVAAFAHEFGLADMESLYASYDAYTRVWTTRIDDAALQRVMEASIAAGALERPLPLDDFVVRTFAP
jgi:NitT/TauT family transport system substrate-binding protein